MSPVRKPQNHSGSFTGKFPSIKMNRMINFESGLERDFIYLLDFDKRITHFEEQPIRIDYKINGKTYSYTPDFHAVVNGENWLYECKPKKFANSKKNQLKFKVAERWCRDTEWGFQVITDDLIRSGCRLKNVKYLTNFSRFVVSSELIAKIYAILHNYPVARLIDVVSQMSDYTPQKVYPALFYLAYHHRLILPIDNDLISPLTEVRLA